jgi:hypothetical protein
MGLDEQVVNLLKPSGGIIYGEERWQEVDVMKGKHESKWRRKKRYKTDRKR